MILKPSMPLLLSSFPLIPYGLDSSFLSLQINGEEKILGGKHLSVYLVKKRQIAKKKGTVFL